jgi:AraC-like DNA-binding protein
MPWINDLRTRILAYIEENISDITLNARDITERFKISRTHLYRIFPYGGGVLRHIQNRRLDLALRCICENPGERISVISSRYGFANDRQFHRHFLRRFEMSPGEARIHWKNQKTSS